jgi:hypothetical protein
VDAGNAEIRERLEPRRGEKHSTMPATAISPADFEVMQSLARAFRAHVDQLPDGTEIVAAVRAEVEAAPHPPETPQRQGKLIAVILELLRKPELSTDQSVALRESFFDVG